VTTAEGEENPFAAFVTELSDGKSWALVQADGWDDFVERLTGLIADLEPRRRQALVMLLFALVDRQLTPEQTQEWLDEHDVESDEGLTEMITWLRQFRPRPDEELPFD
jgi:hypothetical protein